MCDFSRNFFGYLVIGIFHIIKHYYTLKMHKYFLVCLLSLSLVGCTYTGRDTSVDNSQNGNSISTRYPVSMFSLTTKFKDGKWSYSITANMPTPCHSFAVKDVLVAESYPEQVTIKIKVSEPKQDQMCAQVIDSQTIEGTYQASKEATVKITVE
jgi:hypothetical protein